MAITGTPATGGQGTGAGFFNNFFGGNNTPTPTPATPAVPVVTPATPATPVVTPSSTLSVSSVPSRITTNQSSANLASELSKLGGGDQYGQYNQTDPNATTTTDTTTPNDPFITSLNALQANSDAASKSLIASTQAAYQNKMNTVNQQYSNYKAGLQQLGVETNEAQSSPDLLAGHITAAANDQAAKIQTIQSNLTKALMDAQTAKDNSDFKTLNEKMTYVKQLQADKAAAIKDQYDSIVNDSKLGGIYATQNYDDITSVMNGLDPAHQHTFLVGAAKQFGVTPQSLVAGLAAEKTKQDAANYKETRDAQVLAGGGKGSGTSGGLNYTGSQIDSISNFLENGGTYPGAPKGSQVFGGRGSTDDFFDPNAYVAAYQDWLAGGGTTSGFTDKFGSVVSSVNPKSYSILPDALQATLPTADQSVTGGGVPNLFGTTTG